MVGRAKVLLADSSKACTSLCVVLCSNGSFIQAVNFPGKYDSVSRSLHKVAIRQNKWSGSVQPDVY